MTMLESDPGTTTNVRLNKTSVIVSTATFFHCGSRPPGCGPHIAQYRSPALNKTQRPYGKRSWGHSPHFDPRGHKCAVFAQCTTLLKVACTIPDHMVWLSAHCRASSNLPVKTIRALLILNVDDTYNINGKLTQYKINWREHIQRMDNNRLPEKKITHL